MSTQSMKFSNISEWGRSKKRRDTVPRANRGGEPKGVYNADTTPKTKLRETSIEKDRCIEDLMRQTDALKNRMAETKMNRDKVELQIEDATLAETIKVEHEIRHMEEDKATTISR